MNPLSFFNSTSLVFLGVLVLVCALLFVYFENKAREQNHKISSMLSLVSSLTEEVNSIRKHIQSTVQLNPISGGVIKQNSVQNQYYTNDTNDDDLVSVSDDDYDDDDDDDDGDDEDEDDDDDDDGDDDGDDEDDDDDDNGDDIMEEMSGNVIEIGDNVKVLTLLQPIELVSDDENTEFDADDILDDDDDDNASSVDEQDQVKHIEDVKMFDLKSIHLEEPSIVDYKKLSIGKLKTVVADKGLASDTSKMKKHDLLKLLGVD
jgi:hypothetical protein